MTYFLVTVLAIASSLLALVNGECANACNGHGKCTSYDMCICNRNWQANDCSERVCQFGLAHVDTPKGDLDGSGSLSGPSQTVVDNSFVYPYGTTEQFPAMEDTDLNVLTDSAHYYMECSNKGKCDRTTGECSCYDGYDGVACQRASCPGYPTSCSGHGVCKSKKQLAEADNDNVYKLWDRDSTMGCYCDKGYFGPDCSEKSCKVGVDPLYLDDSATIKYSTFDFATLTTSATADFTDGFAQPGRGYWAIRFFDHTGEDWLTQPIIAGASCSAVIDALEAIPNDVIPSGTAYCTLTQNKVGKPENRWTMWDAQHPNGTVHPYRINYNLSIWDADYTSINIGNPVPLEPGTSSGSLLYSAGITGFNTGTPQTGAQGQNNKLSGFIYRIKFYGNPGALPQPEIEIYLDGKRPSLQSTAGKVITKVWTDGQQGENKDYFADHCDNVAVTIAMNPYGKYYLAGMTDTQKNLLKACLGSSDFDTSNNRDVYNWDYGSRLYPHIIKLVRSVTVYTDGGYYAVIWFDSSVTYDGAYTSVSGTFKLLNPFSPPDAFATDEYEVYTTKGTLALTSNASEATFSFASRTIYTVNASYDTTPEPFDGDISCEIGNNNAYKTKYVFHCLNKTDLFTVLNWANPEVNPPHLNLYTAERLYTSKFEYNAVQRFNTNYGGPGAIGTADQTAEMHYMTHSITTDLSTNWGVSIVGQAQFQIYKFFPATESTYNYVSECSNRGVCDWTSGTCGCFPGYTNDDCSIQSSIAM